MGVDGGVALGLASDLGFGRAGEDGPDHLVVQHHQGRNDAHPVRADPVAAGA